MFEAPANSGLLRVLWRSRSSTSRASEQPQRSQAAFFAVVLRRCLDFDSQKSTARTTEPPYNPLVRMLPVPSHGSCIGSRPVHCPQPETELLSVALIGWACVS